ncbi:hypothetical protein GCM10028807_12610 [Spirosoma daeguense]
MKSVVKTVVNGLIISLILTGSVVRAQAVKPDLEALPERQSFEVGTYMGANQTLNLMLFVLEPKGVTLTVRNTKNDIMHELYLKRSPRAYHQKLNFEGSKPGTYRLEISDGRKTVVRRIEVVDIPAIESQRYVTYSIQPNR